MATDAGKSGAGRTNLRLLMVIEEVARAGAPVTPTAVNAVLGLPKPTIHRLFQTLDEEGFIQRDVDGRSYGPGPRMRDLAGSVLSSPRVRTARKAVLRKLSREIGETCNIAIPDRDAMVYLERVETEWPLRIELPIGTRVPLYCTAAGKMYLSTLAGKHLDAFLSATWLEAHTENTLTDPDALRQELSAVRAQGYALDNEEFLDDMIAIAIPVIDNNERLMATLSFHAPTQRYDTRRAIAHLPSMRAASTALSELTLTGDAETLAT